MKLVYKTSENITVADLDQLAVTYSGVVNIGRKCKEVWNTIPCSSCMGRCIGAHPGKARYYQRTPEVQTMLNGKPLGKWGEVINPGVLASVK